MSAHAVEKPLIVATVLRGFVPIYPLVQKCKDSSCFLLVEGVDAITNNPHE